MKNRVIYEQPLNEYTRNLLRFEHLFKIWSFRMKSGASIDNQAVINHTIDIVEFIQSNNHELSIHLARDIELHIKTLEQWQQNPSADSEKVLSLLSQARSFLAKLAQIDELPQQCLSKNHLLNQIWQRKMIAGGAGQTELSCYKAWLYKSSKERQSDLNEWLTSLSMFQEALFFNLYMIRNNSISSQQVAFNGYYKSDLDQKMDFQLIRVILNQNAAYYPEITGSKQRVTIKFWQQPDAKSEPIYIENDIKFQLCCCMK